MCPYLSRIYCSHHITGNNKLLMEEDLDKLEPPLMASDALAGQSVS